MKSSFVGRSGAYKCTETFEKLDTSNDPQPALPRRRPLLAERHVADFRNQRQHLALFVIVAGMASRSGEGRRAGMDTNGGSLPRGFLARSYRGATRKSIPLRLRSRVCPSTPIAGHPAGLENVPC